MTSKDKVSEKVQEAIFGQLLAKDGNTECADCGNRSPTWVSLDFGVFVCIRCSGVHRQIGPHITRVRSTKLDGWEKRNIEIMSAVGNKLANEFYENKMPTGYRKPGPHSSPEECRRFVDDKYINKKFCPKGFPEPVKEFVTARDKGTTPEFGWAKEHHGQSEEHHHHSKSQDHAENHNKPLRKKSLSLDKMPEKKTHHQEDLLSADFNLMDVDRSHSHNDFGEFKQSTHANSTSPVKTINFDNFKKANATNNSNATTNQDNHWAWDMSNLQQPGNTNQNGTQNSQNQQQQQQQPQNQTQNQQTENKIDIMKLYNQQPTPQNNFYNGHHQQQQHHGGWNQPFGGSWGGGMNVQHHGNMQQQQNFYQSGFQQQQNPYGMQQQFHQQQNGHFQHSNGFGGQNMGFNQMSGFAQPNNKGFVQQTQMNKFF